MNRNEQGFGCSLSFPVKMTNFYLCSDFNDNKIFNMINFIENVGTIFNQVKIQKTQLGKILENILNEILSFSPTDSIPKINLW